nr:hypothetical protein Iba_chr14cCG15520 [Ipomoea batatas]
MWRFLALRAWPAHSIVPVKEPEPQCEEQDHGTQESHQQCFPMPIQPVVSKKTNHMKLNDRADCTSERVASAMRERMKQLSPRIMEQTMITRPVLLLRSVLGGLGARSAWVTAIDAKGRLLKGQIFHVPELYMQVFTRDSQKINACFPEWCGLFLIKPKRFSSFFWSETSVFYMVSELKF